MACYRSYLWDRSPLVIKSLNYLMYTGLTLSYHKNTAFFVILIVGIFGSFLTPILSIDYASATSDEAAGDNGGGGDDGGGDNGGGGDEPDPEPEPEPGFVGEPIDPCEENPKAEGCTPEPPTDPCVENPTSEGCEPEPPICKPCPPGLICPDVCEPATTLRRESIVT